MTMNNDQSGPRENDNSFKRRATVTVSFGPWRPLVSGITFAADSLDDAIRQLRLAWES